MPIGYATTITCFDDVAKLFPTAPGDIAARRDRVIAYANNTIAELIAVPENSRTYKNTVFAFDRAAEALRQEYALLDAVVSTHPNKNMREAAHKTIGTVRNRLIEISQDARINRALTAYEKTGKRRETLSREETCFLAKATASYARNGFTLPESKQRKISQLKKQIARLEQTFDKNINDDIKKIDITACELSGMTPEFINTLDSRFLNGTKLYTLSVTGPVITQISQNCTCEKTRKAVWNAYVNRAYPANKKILEKLINLRDRLARTLGYAHYADYEIANEMAGNAQTVERFLRDMHERSAKKVREEATRYLHNPTASVHATADNKIKPWDWPFIETAYRKKNYNLDERLIAEYFPLDHTIKKLIPVFEQFFGVGLTYMQAKNLWDPEIRVLEIRTQSHDPADGKLIGYILLDLFPRPNKYTHACCNHIVPHLKNKTDGDRAGVSLIIANFPAATREQPALLQHEHLTTFLHELGHAFHQVLRSTTMASLTIPEGSIDGIQIDFVEMPSQMLEEFAWQPEILHMIGSHYKTEKPLPEEFITKIITLKNFDSGSWVRRLLTGSYVSLNYFTQGEKKDIRAISKSVNNFCKPYLEQTKDNHWYASFGHLSGYGARYYSYLWSKVYARDLFEYIKKNGFLEAGRRYVEIVLAPYGSQSPHTLLRTFLGREPNSDAFFSDLT